MKKFLLLLIIIFTQTISAKIFLREYTYQASEADSKITSRAIALEQVKRLLLEEIGMYLHATIQSGETEIDGEVKDLTAKQIEIISAGITETKIVDETWNGVTYYIKAEIIADENDVIERLDKVIADKEKTKQLEESNRKTNEAFDVIEKLKLQLAETIDENEKLRIQAEYQQSSIDLSAEDWFQKGLIAHEMQEYDKAIFFNKKVIEIDPEFQEAYMNIAVAFFRVDNIEKSIEYGKKAIEVNPEYVAAFNNLGILYAAIGNFDKAIECFKKAIEINPTHYITYENMGKAYGGKGDNDKSIECLRKAIEIDSDQTGAHYLMGAAYREKGNYDKAIECYKKAIEIDSEHSGAHCLLGLAYGEIGNYDKAIECLQKAIEIQPDDANTYYYLGSTYRFKGTLDKAIEYLRQAARFDHIDAQNLLRENGYSW